eukprot:scaffold94986_cov61-Phaeocystis_antarctica.AAC.5
MHTCPTGPLCQEDGAAGGSGTTCFERVAAGGLELQRLLRAVRRLLEVARHDVHRRQVGVQHGARHRLPRRVGRLRDGAVRVAHAGHLALARPGRALGRRGLAQLQGLRQVRQGLGAAAEVAERVSRVHAREELEVRGDVVQGEERARPRERLLVVALRERAPRELEQREPLHGRERRVVAQLPRGLAQEQRVPEALDAVRERRRRRRGRAGGGVRALRRYLPLGHRLGAVGGAHRLLYRHHQSPAAAAADALAHERRDVPLLPRRLGRLHLLYVRRRARLAHAQPGARLPVEQVERLLEAGEGLLRPRAEEQLQPLVVVDLAAAVARKGRERDLVRGRGRLIRAAVQRVVLLQRAREIEAGRRVPPHEVVDAAHVVEVERRDVGVAVAALAAVVEQLDGLAVVLPQVLEVGLEEEARRVLRARVQRRLDLALGRLGHARHQRQLRLVQVERAAHLLWRDVRRRPTRRLLVWPVGRHARRCALQPICRRDDVAVLFDALDLSERKEAALQIREHLGRSGRGAG